MGKNVFPIMLSTYRAGGAVELAARVDEALGAVAGDAGTQPGDLLVHPGVVLDTARDVRPGPVLLQQKYFISDLKIFRKYLNSSSLVSSKGKNSLALLWPPIIVRMAIFQQQNRQ